MVGVVNNRYYRSYFKMPHDIIDVKPDLAQDVMLKTTLVGRGLANVGIYNNTST